MDAFESFDESVALTHTKGSSFFGCYLLVSLNPRHRNKTYIGFTVDPDRRIRQHNAGRLKGGAKATSGSGPWDMVLIVHGFPNDISALRFEWAWQHPELSRRLTNVAQIRRSNETPFDYRFRILCHMLRTGPWNRLGLVVRWINPRYFRDFPADLSPPLHIPIVYGPLQSSKIVQSSSTIPTYSACDLCFKNFVSTSPQSAPASCPSEHCSSRWHLICIAKYLLRHNQDILSSRIRTADGHTDQVLPLCGACPKCHSSDIFWPKLIEDWKRRQIAIQ